MQIKRILSLAMAAVAAASEQGFNYGATNSDGSCRNYDDFVKLFTRAKNLAGAPGFTSARLYTSIQCGTGQAPISAFKAAVDTQTRLLVGMWASAGKDVYQNELIALINGAKQLGPNFKKLIVGISVGSEDLYRASEQGKQANAGVGADGKTIEGYMGWLRDWAKGTPLEGVPVGHVDTWTAWVLPENQGVINSADFLGHNGFPYFETTHPNAIGKGAENWWSAVQKTESVAKGKPVFLTETGWPSVGPNSRDATANVENARTYWQQVGCPTFGTRNIWWYTLVDSDVNQTNIHFGLTPMDSNVPIFDLTCPAKKRAVGGSSKVKKNRIE